jgi:hypothetical protein
MKKQTLFQNIKTWLDSNGDYADGIALLELVTPKHATLPFFKTIEESKPGEMHYDILKNRLQIEFADLRTHVEIEELDEPKAVESKSLIAEEGKKESGKGVKILKLDSVSQANLPDYLKPFFTRAKEITPLMAKLHADLSDENLPADKAQEATTLLVSLDDERAKCWETIDAWAEQRDELILDDDQDDEPTDDPVKKGLDIAKRITRLNENIARTRKAIETNDRPNIKTRNENKLKAYSDELAELEKQVK